jgi:hypothetical protein
VCSLVVVGPPGQQQTPNPLGTSLSDPGNLVRLPSGKADRKDAYGSASLGGWKKRMSSCNGTNRGFKRHPLRKQAHVQLVFLCERM